MVTRLRILWAATCDSLWFLPAAFTLVAAVAAFGFVQLDEAYDVTELTGGTWLVGGSVDGARSVLSVIAGSLMTVTGVVFSVTIVALQLASSQFTPRILRNFMADRSNQTVLAVFIATFTYTLLVLRVVRSTEDGTPFVPQLSVTLAIVLCLVSIGFLIHFIHHAARAIQVSVILDSVTGQALDQVRKLFPEEIGHPDDSDADEAMRSPYASQAVAAVRSGYLQAVDGGTLFELGEKQQLLIRMARPVGAFVLEGERLADVWSETPLVDAVRCAINNAFVLNAERTPGQDVEFLLLEISDIAVKALSPGINDPTTAMHCIDRLTQILLAPAKRRPPALRRTNEGRVHFIARPTTFESALDVAFAQILHFGGDNPAILSRLHTAIGSLTKLLPLRGTPLCTRCRPQLKPGKGDLMLLRLQKSFLIDGHETADQYASNAPAGTRGDRGSRDAVADDGVRPRH